MRVSLSMAFKVMHYSEGPQAGMRLQNGWQNSGLPWGRSLNPDKIYRLDR